MTDRGAFNSDRYIPKKGDYPDIDWAKEVCKMGQKQDCCRYLAMSVGGYSCEKHSLLKSYIDRRVMNGGMGARGDNCEGKDSR